MTDEQINAAIAEACGFICLHEFQADKEGAKFGFWEYPKNWTGPKKQPWCLDFCTDLNAMHEAEKIMTKAQWEDFVEHLTTDFYSVSDAWKDACHATARQRAEAFLRTLGKWNDQSGDTTEMEVQK